MDFFALCAANAPRLESRFEGIVISLSDTERDTLNTFARTVREKGRVAINMRPTTLLDLLSSERYFNIYEWADRIARKSAKSREVILQEKLKDKYEKRIVFDEYFDRGRGFRYGALNIGLRRRT